MSRGSHGSAAAARKLATPESAERNALLHCLDRLCHTLALASSAAHGAEPETAALYLVETLDELGPDLKLLRSTLLQPRTG